VVPIRHGAVYGRHAESMTLMTPTAICTPNDTLRELRVSRWVRIGVLAAFVAVGVVNAQAGTRVLFSYGAVETLRTGETRWDFLSADVAIGSDDIVRMPPGSLLRLQDDDGQPLSLLSGVGEGTAPELLAIEEAEAAEGAGAYGASAEAAAVDVLPAGSADADGPHEPRVFAFDEVAAAAWLTDKSHELDVVRDAAHAALMRASAGAVYMPEHVAKAQALFAYVVAGLDADDAVTSVFADDAARPVYAFAALLAAADIPARRHVDASGQPFLLLGAGLRRSQIGSVTANRAMYHTRPDGAVEMPLGLAPGQMTLLEAWYAGSGLDVAGE